MSCITRCILRWGLIGGLALGGITLLVGPERVAMGLGQIRAKAQYMVESCVDDTVALRRQLQEMTEEYPRRIELVRGEIAEVDHQIGQFEHDTKIARGVVAMTTEDLGELKTLVARAESEIQTVSSRGDVAIRFQGVRYDVAEAYGEARRINTVRETYKDRLAQDKQQLSFLEEQKQHLSEILAKLESDFATVENQLWQLDRQIDAIERNERLIELTEQQQATLDSYETFGKVGNLKQLEAKLAELRTIQEARFQALKQKSQRFDYEDRVRYELDSSDVVEDDPFGEVELEDVETLDEIASEPDRDTVAWARPVIIIE